MLANLSGTVDFGDTAVQSESMSQACLNHSISRGKRTTLDHSQTRPR